MSKYKVVVYYADGDAEKYDEVFNTFEEACDYGEYLVNEYCSNWFAGQDELYLNNPFEFEDSYIFDECEEPEYEVYEVE